MSNDLFCIPTTASEQNESALRLLDYLNKGEADILDQEAMTDVTTFLDLCEYHPALRAASMDRYSAARLRAELGRAIKDHYRGIHYINDVTGFDPSRGHGLRRRSAPDAKCGVTDHSASSARKTLLPAHAPTHLPR